MKRKCSHTHGTDLFDGCLGCMFTKSTYKMPSNKLEQQKKATSRGIFRWKNKKKLCKFPKYLSKTKLLYAKILWKNPFNFETWRGVFPLCVTASVTAVDSVVYFINLCIFFMFSCSSLDQRLLWMEKLRHNGMEELQADSTLFLTWHDWWT